MKDKLIKVLNDGIVSLGQSNKYNSIKQEAFKEVLEVISKLSEEEDNEGSTIQEAQEEG